MQVSFIVSAQIAVSNTGGSIRRYYVNEEGHISWRDLNQSVDE